MKYADSYMHIKLEVDQEKQAFYVVTKNDGVIIPDEMKEEIFQPFVRFSQKEEGKVTTGAGIPFVGRAPSWHFGHGSGRRSEHFPLDTSYHPGYGHSSGF